MLAVRLARGADPPAQLRRLLLLAVAAGAGVALLGAPGVSLSAWCAVPLAATVHCAAVVARADPAEPARDGLAAAGLGAGRLPTLAAASAAGPGLVGSVVALLVVLRLRDDGLSGFPFEAASTAVLAVVPLAAAGAAALAVRPRAGHCRPRAGRAAPLFRSWPGLWAGAALLAAGAGLGGHAAWAGDGARGATAASALGCWVLVGAGVVVAGPGLLRLCGALLAAGRPGALRLLAGRALTVEDGRPGRSLAAGCAAVAAAVVVLGPSDGRLFGSPGAQGAGVALIGAALAAAVTVGAGPVAGAGSAGTLRRLGASRRLLRSAATLRAAALLAVFAPLAWLTGQLLAWPLR